MNQYALVAFGLLFLIVAAVIFAMYGVMEKRYRSLFRDGPLLRFALPKDSHRMQAEKNIAQLRMKNKALLLVMLFFCALFAVILPFLWRRNSSWPESAWDWGPFLHSPPG